MAQQLHALTPDSLPCRRPERLVWQQIRTVLGAAASCLHPTTVCRLQDRLVWLQIHTANEAHLLVRAQLDSITELLSVCMSQAAGQVGVVADPQGRC